MKRLIYTCNRCGKSKEYAEEDIITTICIDYHKIKWDGYRQKESETKGIDVCEDCLNEFKKWMEGEE